MNNSTITAISETRRGRFALEIDGVFAFSVSPEELLEYGLFQGLELTSDEIEHLRRTSDVDKCRVKAVTFLSMREHSTGELVTKLCRNFDRETACMVVDQMVADGLVDNIRFGQLWANELFEVRLFGPLRMGVELVKRGLSKEEAGEVLADFDFDYAEKCAMVLAVKYPRWQTNPERAIRGMYALGYPIPMTRTAMRENEDSENMYD